MNRLALLTSVAVAVAMSAASAAAQMQQKAPDDKGAPQMQNAPDGQPQGEQKKQDGSQPRAEKAEPKKDSKGTAQSKDQPGKGTAQTEPKEKATKGTAQKSVEPKDKATKGTAEKATESKDKATKGTAEKATELKDKATKGTADKGTAGRVQLSEQQRTNLHQTILKSRNVNRVTNVSFSINVGTRVPRSVRLAPLPPDVIVIVPAYRSYRYFVVEERICIVDPATYEIVEIITVSGQTAGRGGPATLVLTEEERMIILREIDMRGGSTLALGALTEGAEVPRGIELRVFPDTVVQKVSKVRGYKFFTAENRVAIVDPQGARVQLVIEDRR